VVFLDVDGVLNCTGTPARHLEQTCLNALRHIVEAETDLPVGIVLSSSWRLDAEDVCALSHLLLEERILRSGFLGLTPSFKGQGSRSDEIVAWLLLHVEVPVSKFVCIDDMDLECTFSCSAKLLSGHCVKTSICTGLTVLESSAAVALFHSPFSFKDWQIQADRLLFAPEITIRNSANPAISRSAFALLLLNIVLYRSPPLQQFEQPGDRKLQVSTRNVTLLEETEPDDEVEIDVNDLCREFFLRKAS